MNSPNLNLDVNVKGSLCCNPDVKVYRRVLKITVCGPVLHGACSDVLVMADSLQLQGL